MRWSGCGFGDCCRQADLSTASVTCRFDSVYHRQCFGRGGQQLWCRGEELCIRPDLVVCLDQAIREDLANYAASFLGYINAAQVSVLVDVLAIHDQGAWGVF